MSYVVGLHSYGGSAGEAMDPQALVTVATLEEAEVIEKAVKEHPANKQSWYGAVITKVPDTKKLEDAISEIFECYLFEEFEWDGCEDLTDEEYVEEMDRMTHDHITKHVVEFRTGS